MLTSTAVLESDIGNNLCKLGHLEEKMVEGR